MIHLCCLYLLPAKTMARLVALMEKRHNASVTPIYFYEDSQVLVEDQISLPRFNNVPKLPYQYEPL